MTTTEILLAVVTAGILLTIVVLIVGLRRQHQFFVEANESIRISMSSDRSSGVLRELYRERFAELSGSHSSRDSNNNVSTQTSTPSSQIVQFSSYPIEPKIEKWTLVPGSVRERCRSPE